MQCITNCISVVLS